MKKAFYAIKPSILQNGAKNGLPYPKKNLLKKDQMVTYELCQ